MNDIKEKYTCDAEVHQFVQTDKKDFLWHQY